MGTLVNYATALGRAYSYPVGGVVGWPVGMSFLLVSDSDKLSESSQEIVAKLYKTQGRDVVLMDSHQRILADAFPAEIGTIYADDLGNEIGKTIKDLKL